MLQTTTSWSILFPLNVFTDNLLDSFYVFGCKNLKENWVSRRKTPGARRTVWQSGTPTQEKEKREEKKPEDHTEPFANYAAQLQIEFFVKVN